MGNGVYPVKATVMEGDLPINTNDCGTCVFPSKNNSLNKIKIHNTSASDLTHRSLTHRINYKFMCLSDY